MLKNTSLLVAIIGLLTILSNMPNGYAMSGSRDPQSGSSNSRPSSPISPSFNSWNRDFNTNFPNDEDTPPLPPYEEQDPIGPPPYASRQVHTGSTGSTQSSSSQTRNRIIPSSPTSSRTPDRNAGLTGPSGTFNTPSGHTGPGTPGIVI
jgi:hypothetical protein